MSLFNFKLENIEEIKPNLYVQKIKTRKGEDYYKLVYPPKKDLTKPLKRDNINWKNLIANGRWLNLIFIALIVLIILFTSWRYKEETKACYDFRYNASDYCLSVLSNLTNSGGKEGELSVTGINKEAKGAG